MAVEMIITGISQNQVKGVFIKRMDGKKRKVEEIDIFALLGIRRLI